MSEEFYKTVSETNATKQAEERITAMWAWTVFACVLTVSVAAVLIAVVRP
jgi:hypothetical protein